MFDSPVLGIIGGVAALATLVDAVGHRKTLFDGRLTEDERQRIFRLVLFVLLPLSIIAHEVGHAVAVNAFGGRVVDFGFYFVYGFVQHIGVYTPLQLALIAFAGPAVSVLLGLVAIAVAWYRPLPNRPGVNYLLFVFGAVELINALVFYPVLDALGGVSGDWERIYSRDTPLFSALIGLNHLALLVSGLLIWRSPHFQEGYALRTGTRRYEPEAPPSEPPSDTAEQKELAGVLTVAAALATNGWRHPVELVTDHQAGGAQVIVRWESTGFHRALLVHATLADDAQQHVELHAAVESGMPGMPLYQRALARIDGHPTSHELVPYIRRYLDFVDTWNGATVVSPN